MWKYIVSAMLALWRNPFTISIIVGTMLLIIGYTDAVFAPDSTSSWIEFYRTLGTLMFSGGIFVALVKSDQFIGIFKDVLSDIVYGEKHLAERKDLPKIWDNVSEALYHQKFNSLSKELHQNVKECYLPVDHDYYYRQFEVEIEIEFDDENPDYINVIEETRTWLVCDDPNKQVTYFFESSIPLPVNDNDKTEYSLLEFTVDDKPVTKFERKSVGKNDKKTKLLADHAILCKGSREYRIIRREKKRYSLTANPYKGQIAVMMYNGSTVKVTFPKELHIEWVDMGTVNSWDVTPRTTKTSKTLRGDYKGLVFRNQGYLLILRSHLAV